VIAKYFYLDFSLVPGFILATCPDRIDAVLQQLAEIDLGTAVEMVRQKIDDPSEVDLEWIVHRLIPLKRLPRRDTEAVWITVGSHLSVPGQPRASTPDDGIMVMVMAATGRRSTRSGKLRNVGL